MTNEAVEASVRQNVRDIVYANAEASVRQNVRDK